MARLSRQTIVETALELLDRVGLDELSTRKLADALGVQSPALYWHFKNKRALLDAMAEAMFDQAQMPPPPQPSDDPAEWLARRQLAFRRALLARRDGARVHAGSRPNPAQLPSIAAQVEALAAAGLDSVAALLAIRALSRYTVGWVLEEQADSERSDHAAYPEMADYPALRKARKVLAEPDPDADFTFGLTALIDGLIRQAQPRR